MGIHLFLILLLNIDFGYMLEPPHLGSSNVYPQSMFRAKTYEKYNNFSSGNFHFYSPNEQQGQKEYCYWK